VFDEGTDPLAVLGAVGSQLRKLAAVERGLKEGLSPGPAMDAAGIAKWPQARQNVERQLHHLGRRRLARLTARLAEINLGLKGGNPLPGRVQVERFVIQLARPRPA